MSAPRSRGEVMQGEAKVLSTRIRMLGLTFFTAVETAWMSISLRVGFVGVYIHTNFVSYLMRLSTLSTQVISTKSIFKPCLSYPNFFMQRKVPPQTSSQEITWSPCLRVWRTVAVAPHPLAQVIACVPYQTAAKQISKAYLVGFPPLEQSNFPQG